MPVVSKEAIDAIQTIRIIEKAFRNLEKRLGSKALDHYRENPEDFVCLSSNDGVPIIARKEQSGTLSKVKTHTFMEKNGLWAWYPKQARSQLTGKYQ